MKKLLALVLVFLTGLSLFVACSHVDKPADDNPADGTPTYLYTDFTDEEKAAFVDLVGETIPFLPARLLLIRLSMSRSVSVVPPTAP